MPAIIPSDNPLCPVGRRPSGARLYHRGSRFGPPERRRLDRNVRIRIYHLAIALDRRTREKRQHGGVLKRTGLAVLHELLFAFLNMRDGSCFPSMDAIAQAARCCVETVRKAIRALEAAGIVETTRRKVVASFSRGRARFDIAVQCSSSYVFNMPLPDRAMEGDLTLRLLGPVASSDQFKLADTRNRHETTQPVKTILPPELAAALERLGQAIDGTASSG